MLDSEVQVESNCPRCDDETMQWEYRSKDWVGRFCRNCGLEYEPETLRDTGGC